LRWSPAHRPSTHTSVAQGPQEPLVQPIIFDHVNKVVVQVGKDPTADKKFAELIAAQRPPTS